MEKYVVVATFTMPWEAQLACGRLEAEGILAHVLGDAAASAFGVLSAVGGKVELYVSAADAERALTVLAECMPEEHWRVMMAEHLQPARTALSEWTPNDGIQLSAANDGEKDASLWVCSVCGDAVSVAETVCPACGTSREALRPAQSEDVRESHPVERASLPHLHNEETVSARPALEADFEAPEPDDRPAGDVLAGRALKVALLSLLIPPLCVWSFSLLLELLCYDGTV